MPALNRVAPAFSLPSDTGDRVALKDFRGQHVVLYFYPKDDTETCTKEACEFRDGMPALTALDAVVLGVSPDSVKSHAKFRAKYALPFTLLSDPDHAVAEQYGVWQEKVLYGRTYMGIVRTTFIIDARGRLRRVFEKVKSAGHAEEVRAALAAL